MMVGGGVVDGVAAVCTRWPLCSVASIYDVAGFSRLKLLLFVNLLSLLFRQLSANKKVCWQISLVNV